MLRRTAFKVALLAFALATIPSGWAMAHASRPSNGHGRPTPSSTGGAATVYVANEQSGTVSVIDAATMTIVDTICLGSDPAIPGTPQPNGPCNAEADHHKPFYDGHLAPHGLWLTPDGSVLLVANRLSGTVVAIDTATNKVLGYAPVGREPHLATVRPGGREAWVAVRGESHIDVLKLDKDDLYKAELRPTDRMDKIASINTVAGPSMVSFTSDGKFAFVAAGKQNRVDKIDANSRKVIASQTVPAPFTPFGLVSPDDKELYLVHKGAGALSILRTSDLGHEVTGMPIGPRANHIWFLGNLAYITIAGPAPSQTNPTPEGKIVILDRTSHEIVRELTGAAFTGEPHGIWSTPDGKRLFVGHETGGRVTVIDTGDVNDPDDDTVLGTVSDSNVKQPIDVVVKP